VSSDSSVQIGKVTSTIEWLMTPVGLLIDHVEFEGESWRLEPSALEKSTGSGTFVATVRAKSIEVFLENLKPADLYDISVSVALDGVHIEGKKQVIVPIPVTAHAVLALSSPSELSIQLVSAAAMGAGLKNLVSSQIEKMNPIVEADMFPVPVVFEGVEHRDGEVVVRGTVRLS
jgi:hypothetical protein